MSEESVSPDVRPLSVLDESAAVRARPYAEALLNVAEAQGDVDSVLDEFDEIVRNVLEPYPRFADLLADPSLATVEKDRILTDAFQGKISDVALRFLRVLNRHGRLDLIAPVAREARTIWDRRQNRKPVEVRSALPLEDDQKQRIVERLAGWIGGTPIVAWKVDPGLLGGLTVKVGDQVYDASLKNRLEQYRRRIVESRSRSLAGAVVEP